VDRGYFLLDTETVDRKVAGDIEELAGDDVSDSTDGCGGEHARDDNRQHARNAPVLKAADRRNQ
jgi:hypothetical protein